MNSVIQTDISVIKIKFNAAIISSTGPARLNNSDHSYILWFHNDAYIV